MTTRPDQINQLQTRIMVIGVGNPDRGDDAVGLLVARNLRSQCPTHIEILEVTGGLVSLLDTWQNADSLILVDASVSQGNPGDIRRFDPNQEPLSACSPFPSTHGFGVAEIIGLAQALGNMPRRFLIYAIEGTRFEPGSEMSPEVRTASNNVTGDILNQIRLWEQEISAGGEV
jgi:hydrogenase maturation protease